MIRYVIASNPDDRDIQLACDRLSQGEIICFPTDTNWVLACDPQNKQAVSKLYGLKQEDPKKHFSIICDSISMASDYALISNSHFRLLNKLIPGHYTFIFEATKQTAKMLKASKVDKEIGIRFVPTKLCNKIISTYTGALLTTNIINEFFDVDFNYEIHSYMIEEAMPQVSLIIDPGEHQFAGQSSILEMITEQVNIIREGVGDVSFLQ